MFKDINNSFTKRLIEVREFLNLIVDNTPDFPSLPKPSIVIAKGLFFVHLYGIIEFTITSTVARSIGHINSFAPNVNDCKPVFMTVALNNECDSLFGVGRKKKWEKRRILFNKFQNNTQICINDDIMPTDGKNFQYGQLESIWLSFGIEKPVLPRMEIRGILTEIVENRTKVAHGIESPHVIGQRYSIEDLKIRFDYINELCSYIITIFEDYISNMQFIK